MNAIKKFYSQLTDSLRQLILLENNCLVCECLNKKLICNDCLTSLSPANIKPTCQKCALLIPPMEISCQNCAEHSFYFDHIIAGYEYAFPLNKILHQLKYFSQLGYSKLLSELFFNAINSRISNNLPDVIITVPLHKSKQIARGFNQVDELLYHFRDKYPQIKQLTIARTKSTEQQAALNQLERKQNLKNAFTIKHNLANLHVVIVDDVVTTGATVNAIAKQCKLNGAKRVDIWCLMRAQNH